MRSYREKPHALLRGPRSLDKSLKNFPSNCRVFSKRTKAEQSEQQPARVEAVSVQDLSCGPSRRYGDTQRRCEGHYPCPVFGSLHATSHCNTGHGRTKLETQGQLAIHYPRIPSMYWRVLLSRNTLFRIQESTRIERSKRIAPVIGGFYGARRLSPALLLCGHLLRPLMGHKRC